MLTTPKPDSVAVFAHYEGTLPAILYASKADGTFVPASQLQAAGMFPEFVQLFAEADPRDPLPVTLAEFNVKHEGAANLLEWTTASEMNSDHFEIEWSANAKNWTKIGEVAGVDAGIATTHYTFSDHISHPGIT